MVPRSPATAYTVTSRGSIGEENVTFAICTSPRQVAERQSMNRAPPFCSASEPSGPQSRPKHGRFVGHPTIHGGFAPPSLRLAKPIEVPEAPFDQLQVASRRILGHAKLAAEHVRHSERVDRSALGLLFVVSAEVGDRVRIISAARPPRAAEGVRVRPESVRPT